MAYFDAPTILLKALDGTEQFVQVPAILPEYLVPKHPRMQIIPGDNSPLRSDRRVFRRSKFQSAKDRWWRIYNEGRSRTPEPVPVYFEVREQ